jgi:hypothetical protein
LVLSDIGQVILRTVSLPLGAADLGSSFSLVIPSVLYPGDIARKTGDIGFEFVMVVTALLYVPLRHLEKRWRGV